MSISAPPQTESPAIRGVVHRAFFSSPSFSAGLLRTEDGSFVRFRGSFHATEGDSVALIGRWVKDAKFGRQFEVEQLCYDLPDTHDGLVQYLASHPAFKGIGLKTAEKLVAHAGDGESLDRLLRGDLEDLHRRLRIPLPVLRTLRDAWIASAAENEIRAFLAGFGLTGQQTTTLLETYGNAVVGILRNDPYVLIKHLDGYGFRRVDKIARRMGVPKNHPGRIEAAITYCLTEELAGGHTWTAGSDLLDKANEVLFLDGLDSRDTIRKSADSLLEEGRIVADGSAVSTSWIRDAERLIFDTLRTHARAVSPIPHAADPRLNARQQVAFDNALSHSISVISGGAGTGKTFVVSRLAETFRTRGISAALCAPTGKAAKRIEELMRLHGVDLEAATIHRLLRYDGRRFNLVSLSDGIIDTPQPGRTGESHPGYDAVIADEVSMVDVPLLAELLRRIDFARTRLVLVGDHNQLPPVGPGNVLRDVIHHNLAPTTVLTEVVRQAGILKANSTRILSGAVAPTAVNDPAWAVIDSFREAGHIAAYLRELILRMIPERLGYDPVWGVQIITPTHKGPLGTKAINEMMQFLLHGRAERRFAVGDKVIQTANDYEMGVMNGTIGRVVDCGRDGCHVDFDGRIHEIGRDRLGNLQLAYALTAHKAQGSEFPCAVVICHRSHYFADRNWLYTAVTRAAKTCILVGDRWGLQHAADKNNTIARRTFLGLWSARAARTPGTEGTP